MEAEGKVPFGAYDRALYAEEDSYKAIDEIEESSMSDRAGQFRNSRGR